MTRRLGSESRGTRRFERRLWHTRVCGVPRLGLDYEQFVEERFGASWCDPGGGARHAFLADDEGNPEGDVADC